MAEKKRAFIAVELPGNVRVFLGRLQESLQGAGVRARWVNPESIHLTLHFFGEIPVARIEPAQQAMAEAAAGVGPMDLAARGLGVFPGIRRARVVWAGVGGGTDALFDLQRRLAERLVRGGFKVERRPFRAHLTLGRFKKPADPAVLAAAVETVGGYSDEPFSVSKLVLFESRLKPEGAIYTHISEMMLEAGRPQPAATTVDGRKT